MNISPVILCGGVGSRLWPLSKETYPKQFIPILDGNTSLLQMTALRMNKEPIIITNKNSEHIIKEQIENYSLILEPCGRNTAPAIAMAAMMKPNDILLIFSADQVINNMENFNKVLPKALELSSSFLVTFGITPTYPETGYGYILHQDTNVIKFVEKPNLSLAEKMISDGNCLWNAGIFCFSSKEYLNALEKYSPKIYFSCLEVFQKSILKNNVLEIHDSYSNCPSDSIDYAVLEKAKNISVIKTDIEWRDVGTWNSVYDISSKDENDNVILGNIYIDNVSNSYIRSQDKLIAVSNLKDVVIIQNEDSILVMDKKSNLKSIVEDLKKQNRKEVIGSKLYYSWGSLEIINQTSSYTISKYKIKSYESIYFDSKKNINFLGEAILIFEDKKIYLEKGDSHQLLSNVKYQLNNPKDIVLELIVFTF